jgi:hypothetical protein
MEYTWYVSVEVPKNGSVLRRRSPRQSQSFKTEAEAKEFARSKYEAGLEVTAGTLNPLRPRIAISSGNIPLWLETGQHAIPPDQETASRTTAKSD